MSRSTDGGGLFERRPERERSAPLAERLRPRSLDEVVGQERALGPGSLLRQLVGAKHCPSLIFWGPPGVGKTTIARITAATSGLRFETLSAVSSGLKELREVVSQAKEAWRYEGRGTVLFVDEVHRWSKPQQDALLPHIEDGTIVFLGATTENPSFEVVAPLLSRARVVVLEPLGEDALTKLLERALKDRERGLGALEVEADPEALLAAARLAGGDARSALNILETAAVAAAMPSRGEAPGPATRRIDRGLVLEAAQRSAALYDRGGDAHYDAISAFIKSLRGSDPDGALYWLTRMLEGGEDPVFLARRLVIFASEDVGLADPMALVRATAAAHAVQLVGMPEAGLNLAQATLDLALAPKSNAAKVAWFSVRDDVRELPAAAVPLHLRNAPTPLMKQLGNGEGYLYPHEFKEGVVPQTFLPREVRDLSKRLPYYRPTAREPGPGRRLEEVAALKARAAREGVDGWRENGAPGKTAGHGRAP
jgi:putative ATPase